MQANKMAERLHMSLLTRAFWSRPCSKCGLHHCTTYAAYISPRMDAHQPLVKRLCIFRHSYRTKIVENKPKSQASLAPALTLEHKLDTVIQTQQPLSRSLLQGQYCSSLMQVHGNQTSRFFKPSCKRQSHMQYYTFYLTDMRASPNSAGSSGLTSRYRLACNSFGGIRWACSSAVDHFVGSSPGA